MTLKIDLTLEPTELTYQQDVQYRLTLTNEGREPLTLLNPATSYTMPIWHVLAPDSGQERTFRLMPRAQRAEPPEQRLEPGQSRTRCGSLFDHIEPGGPGRHEIRVEYHWNGGAFSGCSEPVVLTVTPSTPRAFHMVSERGMPSALWPMVWVDQAETGAHLMMGKLSFLDDHPEIIETHPVEAADVAPQIQPCLCVPRNGTQAGRYWVAWLRGYRLVGFRVDHMLQPDDRRVQPTDLPEVPMTVVPPLLPVPEIGEGAAAAVLCQTAPATGRSNLQLAIIDERGRVQAGGALPIQGGQPAWTQTTALSSGDRRMYAVARQADPTGRKQLTLQAIAWPKGQAELEGAGQALIEGTWLGAACTLTFDDRVLGAVLTEASAEPDRHFFQLHRWHQPAGGSLQLEEPLRLDVAEPNLFDQARLALDDQDKIHAMVHRIADDQWFYFDSDKLKMEPLPEPAAHAAGRVELVLMGQRRPYVMYTRPYVGFQFEPLVHAPSIQELFS